MSGHEGSNAYAWLYGVVGCVGVAVYFVLRRIGLGADKAKLLSEKAEMLVLLIIVLIFLFLVIANT